MIICTLDLVFSDLQIIKSVMHRRVVRMELLVYRRQMDPR